MYTATFFLLQARLYQGFQMSYSDLAHFVQTLHNSLHGRLLWSMGTRAPGGQGSHYFGGHLSLCVFPILLLYALIPHVYTLFFLQALAGGVGAFAVFLLARDMLWSEFAATCFSLAYLFYPSLQWANLNILIWGFHVENLFPPLLLFAFYFLKRGRQRLFAIFFLLGLTITEYYAILLASLSLFILLTDKQHRRVAVATFCISLLWFVAATWWIIPYFRGGSSPWYFDAKKPGGIGNLLRQPLLLVPQLIRPFPAYLFVLLAPVLFLPLASFPVFTTVFPNLFLYFSAPAGGYHIPLSPISWHVNAFIPMVFISAILGMRNILRLVEKRLSGKMALQISSLVLLIVMVFLDYWWGPFPFSSAVRPGRYVLDEDRIKSVQEVKTMIPQDASLSVTSKLSSHFSQRRFLYSFDDRWETADYILIGFDPAQNVTGRELQNSRNHELIYSSHDVYLFRNRFAKPVIQHTLQANLGGKVQLLGYVASADRVKAGDELKLTLYWQALEEMKTSYTVFTHLVDESGGIWGQKDNLPVDRTYLTTEWRVGEIVIDKYEIEVDPTTVPGEYTLEVGMYEWISGERLPVLNADGQVEDDRVILGTVWVEEP
ncbi:MAG: DUF2079 domain-containing protein [Anaerolineae bacterium]